MICVHGYFKRSPENMYDEKLCMDLKFLQELNKFVFWFYFHNILMYF